MLIQVAINNIESVEQGEEILKKWHYHLDEDQSHVVIEREESGAVVRISGFHPWADELGEDGKECCGGDDSCGCGGDNCCAEGHEHGENEPCTCHHEDAPPVEDEEGDDEGGDESDEESEVIYLGQALFVPAEDQARALATEMMSDDYIGTVTVTVDGSELSDTDAFHALPSDTKDSVIAAIEELGDAEAYLSVYEVMGLKD
jgi:hypothetical protein